MPIKHTRREIQTDRPIHCILKTKLNISFQDKGSVKFIKYLLGEIEKRYTINVFQHFINKNHLHLFIYTPLRENLSKAIQYLASMIALKFNKVLKRKGKFWFDRFFSSVKRTPREIIRTLYYISTQIKNIDPFKIQFSSLFEYNIYPFKIPKCLLNFIGAGKSEEKLMNIFLKSNYLPYPEKNTKKQKIKNNNLQLSLF